VTASAPWQEPTEQGSESGVALDSALVASITALYKQHHTFVWRNARRLGCGDDWLDDAVHEVFLVVTRRLSEFQGRAQPRTWLFAITFRVTQRMRRDRARQRGHVRRYAEQLPPSRVVPDEAAAEYLRYLMLKLPVAQQLVFMLAELEGFTSSEIAETLGIPVGTVHSRLRTAKQSLARAIEQERQHGERSEP
jgi:RNA polymerase sigma-70 factor (ECF subfamily)